MAPFKDYLQVEGSDTGDVKEECSQKRFTPGNRSRLQAMSALYSQSLRKQFPFLYEKLVSVFHHFCSDFKVHRKACTLKLKALWGRSVYSKESWLKVGRTEKS